MEWGSVTALCGGLAALMFGLQHAGRGFVGGDLLAGRPSRGVGGALLSGARMAFCAPSGPVGQRAVLTAARARRLSATDAARCHVGASIGLGVLGLAVFLPTRFPMAPTLLVVMAVGLGMHATARVLPRPTLVRAGELALGWSAALFGAAVLGAGLSALADSWRLDAVLSDGLLRGIACLLVSVAATLACGSWTLVSAIGIAATATKVMDITGAAGWLAGAQLACGAPTYLALRRAPGDSAALTALLVLTTSAAAAQGALIAWGLSVAQNLVGGHLALSAWALALAPSVVHLALLWPMPAFTALETLLPQAREDRLLAGFDSELERTPLLAGARVHDLATRLHRSSSITAREIFLGTPTSEQRNQLELERARTMQCALYETIQGLDARLVPGGTHARLLCYLDAADAQVELDQRIAGIRALPLPRVELPIPRRETVELLDVCAHPAATSELLGQYSAMLDQRIAHAREYVRWAWHQGHLAPGDGSVAESWVAAIPALAATSCRVAVALEQVRINEHPHDRQPEASQAAEAEPAVPAQAA